MLLRFYEFMRVQIEDMEENSDQNDDTLDDPAAMVATLVTILFVSFFASSFPSLSNRISFLRIPHVLFFIGKHFGTGVILSTAFVHLLQDSFQILLSIETPLKKWVGLIVLTSLLSIFLVEYVSMSYVERLEGGIDLGHQHHHVGNDMQEETRPYHTESANEGLPSHPESERYSDDSEPSTVTAVSTDSDATASEITPLLLSSNIPRPVNRQAPSDTVAAYYASPSRRYNRRAGCSKIEHYASIIKIPPPNTTAMTDDFESNRPRRTYHDDGAGDGAHNVKEMASMKQVVGILVLQTGIMIHSIVIGLTLSLTSGSKFASLVTAIIFHQLFEGLSLGIRISSVRQGDGVTGLLKFLKPSLIVLFSVTMPVSIVIGLHTLPHGGHAATKLQMQLTRGLMSAISAGMLIYATCVEMLAGDFTTDPSLMRGSRRRQALAVVSLLVGAAAMAILGIWQ